MSRDPTEISFHLTFFDRSARKFVGSTWTSKPTLIKPCAPEDELKTMICTIPPTEVFLTSDPRPTISVVFELVLTAKPLGRPIRHKSLGWTELLIFEHEPRLSYQRLDATIPDTQPTTCSAMLNKSSPLLLLYSRERSSLQASSRIAIRFRAFAFPELSEVKHLLHSWSFIGQGDDLFGLPRKRFTLDSFQNIEPRKLFISDPFVKISNEFETQFLQRMQQIAAQTWCQDLQEYHFPRIHSRTLKLSIHNRRTYIIPIVELSLSPNENASKLISKKLLLEVDVEADPTDCCLVVWLSYMVEWVNKNDPRERRTQIDEVCLGTAFTMIDHHTFVDSLDLALVNQSPPGSNLLAFNCGKVEAGVKAVWEVQKIEAQEPLVKEIIIPKEVPIVKPEVVTMDCGTDPIPWEPEITKDVEVSIPVVKKEAHHTEKEEENVEAQISTLQRSSDIAEESMKVLGDTFAEIHPKISDELKSVEKCSMSTLDPRLVVNLEEELLSEATGSSFAIQIDHIRQTTEQMQSFPIEKARINFEFFGHRVKSSILNVVTEDPRTLQPEGYRFQRRLDPLLQQEFGVAAVDRESFVEYLYNHKITIQFVDGTSQLHFGHCRASLREMIFLGRNEVDVSVLLDLVRVPPVYINGVIYEAEWNLGLGGESIGQVSLRFRHLKIQASGEALLQEQTSRSQLLHNVRLCPQIQCLCSADLNSQINQRIRRKPRNLSSNSELSAQLLPTRTHQTLQQLKNRRLQSSKTEVELGPAEYASELLKRRQNLEAIQAFRARRKALRIDEFVRNQISHTRLIRPRAGELIFFEVGFTNPWDQACDFFIRIEDPCGETSLVCNLSEWVFHKHRLALQTKTKRSLFAGGESEISCEPKEAVFIPFKFQSFRCGRIGDQDSSHEQMLERDVHISILNKEGNAVCAIKILVQPQAFTRDACHTFDHWASEKLSVRLKLPPIQQLLGTEDESLLTVRCPNEDISFSVQDDCDNMNLQELEFRCLVGEYPNQGTFYLFIYNDIYCSSLNQVWQIIVNAKLRSVVSCEVGGARSWKLYLSPLSIQNETRLGCFTDSSKQLLIDEKIITAKNGLKNSFHFTYLAATSGTQYVRFNIVDLHNNNIIESWILGVHSTMPAIRRTYKIDIPCGKSLAQILPYKNCFNKAKRYALNSSHPHILTVKIPTLEIDPEENVEIPLFFHPFNKGYTEEVYLYITESGQVEECLKFLISQR